MSYIIQHSILYAVKGLRNTKGSNKKYYNNNYYNMSGNLHKDI